MIGRAVATFEDTEVMCSVPFPVYLRVLATCREFTFNLEVHMVGILYADFCVFRFVIF